ncbi:MAG TPA: carbonic anhydrase [Rugosimonospora sp.]|nr:carbonic anhydrase [Rugosimonospora sp.]
MTPTPPPTPDSTNPAWTRLREGNTRWSQGRSTADGSRGAARRAELTASQSPFALILGCSDSRVPAEILFDQGLGDLFVVRTAGHVLDTTVLGSVEYAIQILHICLIVVLGHEDCGAITAATRIIDHGQVPPGYIRDIAERITPDVLRARTAGAATIAQIAGLHTLYTIERIQQRSALIDHAIHTETVTAVPAQYCLNTGTVTIIQPPTNHTNPPHTYHTPALQSA